MRVQHEANSIDLRMSHGEKSWHVLRDERRDMKEKVRQAQQAALGEYHQDFRHEAMEPKDELKADNIISSFRAGV